MSVIILDPVDTLSLTTPCGPLAKLAFNKFTGFVQRAGAKMYRGRNTNVKDDNGNVISLSTEVLPFDGFLFDTFTSDIMTQAGMSDRADSTSGGQDAPRAYVHEGVDVFAGDYILLNFDVDNETYDGRYEVIEKEAHNVQGCNIFHTLYLVKRPT